MNRPDVPRVWRTNVRRARARTEGEDYGRAGLSRDCNPHPDGSALSLSWDKGWRNASEAHRCSRPAGQDRR